MPGLHIYADTTTTRLKHPLHSPKHLVRVGANVSALGKITSPGTELQLAQ